MNYLQNKIAPMAREHLDGCVELLCRTPLFKEYGLTAAGSRKMLSAALSDPDQVLLVALAERLAGFAWFVPRGAFARSGYLRLIAVNPDYYGRGVGGRLMDTLERRYLEPHGILLLASDHNPPAHSFYEGRGYCQVGLLQDYVKPGLHERLYYKSFRAV